MPISSSVTIPCSYLEWRAWMHVCQTLSINRYQSAIRIRALRDLSRAQYYVKSISHIIRHALIV